jgi:guanyl-specific ribonuclease Sa
MRIPGLPRLPDPFRDRPRRRRRRPVVLGVGAALIMALVVLVQAFAPAARAPAPGPATAPVAVAPAPAQVAPAAPADADLAPIPVVGGAPVSDPDQVREIRMVLALAARGPPYLHRQDGTSFQNRERRLPAMPRGHYREFTVRTPGENDRGARRLVIGKDGVIWYTIDHYQSFRRLDLPPVIPVPVAER